MANGLDNTLTTEFVRMFHNNHKLLVEGAIHGAAAMLSEGWSRKDQLGLGVLEDYLGDSEELVYVLYGGLDWMVQNHPRKQPTLVEVRDRLGKIAATACAAHDLVCRICDEYELATEIDLGEVAATDAAIQERTQ